MLMQEVFTGNLIRALVAIMYIAPNKFKITKIFSDLAIKLLLKTSEVNVFLTGVPIPTGLPKSKTHFIEIFPFTTGCTITCAMEFSLTTAFRLFLILVKRTLQVQASGPRVDRCVIILFTRLHYSE